MTGDPEAALASYQRSIELREWLAAKHPDDPGIQDDVAECYNNLGNLQRDLGQEAEAVKSYQHAIEIREQLEADHGSVTKLEARD